MTVAETIASFKNNIDQYSTARAGDIDYWINQGIEGFVKDRLSPLMKKNHSFQSNQRIRDDLSDIVKFNVTGSYTNGVLTRPTEAYEIIANSIGCQTTEQEKKEIKYIYARARTWDWYFASNRDPFIKPVYKAKRLIYIESDDGIYLFPNLDYDAVVLSYIEIWVPFSESGDTPIPLHEKTHSEITRLSAAKYLLSIGNDTGANSLLMQNTI
jgi:hypothetical protein